MSARILMLAALCVLAEGSGWDGIANLRQLDTERFREIVSPVIQIAANTYRYPRIIPIAGWDLAPGVKPLAPEEGAHALLYIEQASGNSSSSSRLVIGFRGTDMVNDADKCADVDLFDSFISGLQPPDCSRFSKQTLDYFTQAVNYTKRVLQAYPQGDILVTGHSLGAALATLVSAYFSSSRIIPVLIFSSPPMQKVLQKKSVQLDRVLERQLVYMIADRWDSALPLMIEQVGTVCLYDTLQPPECVECEELLPGDDDQDRNHRIAMESDIPSCMECFVETHILKHIIQLVMKAEKPACKQLSNSITLKNNVK